MVMEKMTTISSTRYRIFTGGTEPMKSKGKWITLCAALTLCLLSSLLLMRSDASAQPVNQPAPPPGTDLLVASYNNDSILRYDGTTGNFVSAFVSSGSGGLSRPQGITYGPDGNLYVSSSL